MTYEEIYDYLESFASRYGTFDEEYLKFELIPESDRMHPSYPICGILKLSSISKNPASFDFCAEHDIVYLITAADCKLPISDEDIIYLQRCGVSFDRDTDSFTMNC